MSEGHRTGTAYYVTAGLFVLLLVAGAALVVSMAMRPEPAAPKAAVSTATDPVSCPTKTRSMTCFRSDVTNTGGSTGEFTCTVDAANANATFQDGSAFTLVTIGAGETDTLISQVERPKKGQPPVPLVRCAMPTA
jgi:hypothetical protein